MNIWTEYDACADWLAVRGLRGDYGDPLPELLSVAVIAEINADVEAFQERVRGAAYARACQRRREAENVSCHLP